MASTKKKATGVKNVKLTNSMAQLVAGIIPGGQKARPLSSNGINMIGSLAQQVRGDYLTLNYPLLTCL